MIVVFLFIFFLPKKMELKLYTYLIIPILFTNFMVVKCKTKPDMATKIRWKEETPKQFTIKLFHLKKKQPSTWLF